MELFNIVKLMVQAAAGDTKAMDALAATLPAETGVQVYSMMEGQQLLDSAAGSGAPMSEAAPEVFSTPPQQPQPDFTNATDSQGRRYYDPTLGVGGTPGLKVSMPDNPTGAMQPPPTGLPVSAPAASGPPLGSMPGAPTMATLASLINPAAATATAGSGLGAGGGAGGQGIGTVPIGPGGGGDLNSILSAIQAPEDNTPAPPGAVAPRGGGSVSSAGMQQLLQMLLSGVGGTGAGRPNLGELIGRVK